MKTQLTIKDGHQIVTLEGIDYHIEYGYISEEIAMIDAYHYIHLHSVNNNPNAEPIEVTFDHNSAYVNVINYPDHGDRPNDIQEFCNMIYAWDDWYFDL